MTRKSGLGKGLSALIPAEYAMDGIDSPPTGLFEVPIGSVVPNSRQPRSHFGEESLAGLTASIVELGVLQPILVRAIEGGYELIAGERRWRAAKRAGLAMIPVVVRTDADGDRQLLEQALVENLHRDDLNALEEAAAYQQLIEDFGLTQEAVAKRVGKSRATISNTLRLFLLPPAIQSLVADESISAGHARALLGSPDRAFQQALAKQIVEDGLSVRETEEAIRVRNNPEPDESGDEDIDDGDVAAEPVSQPSSVPELKLREPGLLELEQLLSDHLETRVQVSMGSGRGKVVVQFADLPDLERIYRKMAMPD